MVKPKIFIYYEKWKQFWALKNYIWENKSFVKILKYIIREK